MKPTVTLMRYPRGGVFHITAPRRGGGPRCGRQQPITHEGETRLHVERGVDADVVRLAGYPVCAECRRLTDHDREREGAGAGAPSLF